MATDFLIGAALLAIGSLAALGKIHLGSGIVPYVLVGIGAYQLFPLSSFTIAKLIDKIKYACTPKKSQIFSGPSFQDSHQV